MANTAHRYHVITAFRGVHRGTTGYSSQRAAVSAAKEAVSRIGIDSAALVRDGATIRYFGVGF